MKTYKHLYEKYISDENYNIAIKDATRYKTGNKKKNIEAQYYRDHASELHKKILFHATHFANDKHRPKIIYDGVRRKQRKILVPTMREQVVHHMVINVLKPIMMRPMYEHAYGSIPGRGSTCGRKKDTKGGKEAIEKFIKRHPKDVKYCLKMDIHKFFDSVPHDKLMNMFYRIIKDDSFNMILRIIISANESNVGIPIGYYTSQWFANFYLTTLDHYIKERLHAKGYFRYMDDMVIFGSNKRELHRIRNDIETYLNSELELSMNPDWQVFRFHYIRKNGKEVGRFLDFMGFRFYRNRTVLRRSLMLRLTRKARRLSKKRKKTIYDCRQMLSYKGWLTPTNTYGMYTKWVKPFVSFRHLRRLVGRVQRYENRKRKDEGTCGTKPEMVVLPNLKLSILPPVISMYTFARTL